MSEKFLLDTSAFIQAYNAFYAPDIAPSFWVQLSKILQADNVAVLDKVAQEIQKGNDSLQKWFQQQENKGAVKIIPSSADEATIAAYAEVMQYIAESGLYKEAASRAWARGSVADPWLIAAAKVYGYRIITFEKSAGTIVSPSKNPKIPDVAAHFGVQCEDLYYFMRQMGISL